jgi:hypothetical protein
VSLTTWAAVGLSLLLVCRSTTAPRADDESDRRRYLADIESKLGSAASELSGFENDSDAGDLDRAMSAMREVESLVDKLDDVKGDDSRAQGCRLVLSALHQRLVRGRRVPAAAQGQAAPGPRVPDVVQGVGRRHARTGEDRQGRPNAADELSTFAKSVGRQGEDAMNDARRVRDQLDDAADEVDDFSVSTNNWSRVSSSTRDSGAAMWRNWDRDFQEAVRACEEVIKRERHRAIEEALSRLANSGAGRKELMAKLTELLRVVADRVNDVTSQSSDSNVAGAIEVTREIASQLDRLRSAQGDDAEAARIAAEWPAGTRSCAVALEGLRAMPSSASAAPTKAPSKCTGCRARAAGADQGDPCRPRPVTPGARRS